MINFGPLTVSVSANIYRLSSIDSTLVIGGVGSGYHGNESQEAIVKKCLVGLGYKVFN